jgi:hypothetical protein
MTDLNQPKVIDSQNFLSPDHPQGKTYYPTERDFKRLGLPGAYRQRATPKRIGDRS